MHKLIHGLLYGIAIAVLCGCSPQKPAAVVINDIHVSAEEFERAFQSSPYAKDHENGKRKFLDLYITSKLILQEAVREGLDRKQNFLTSIQVFWEQSLLKLMIGRKSRELLETIHVSDSSITEYYQKNKERFAGKDLPAVYNDIKILLLKNAQNDLIQTWTEKLRQKARVSIDYKLLSIKP